MMISCSCGKKKQKDDNKPNNGLSPKVTEENFADLSVRSYTGENGVVAAASPYAAKAGLEILEKGGNAFDAAVAVSFALGVTEPNASGLGGGGLMVAYNASKKEYVGYNFREFAPGGVTDALNTKNKASSADSISNGTGKGYSCGVPTQVAGLLKIEEELGKLTLNDVITPAINYAENGFKVTASLAFNLLDQTTRLTKYNNEYAFRVFTDPVYHLDWLTEGETLIQTDYANSLKLIRDNGLDGFYKGATANAILTVLGNNGGVMTQADLDYAKANYPIKFDPLVGEYKGYKVVTTNVPSSGGVVLIESLNMLNEYFGETGLKNLGHNSAEYINAVATALWLSYGDKNKYVADFNHDTSVPNVLSGLTNKDYAGDRFARAYNEGKAYYSDTKYGDPSSYVSMLPTDSSYEANESHFSTTTFSVADKEGNIVTFTQTINMFFGCGLMGEGTGFYLNDNLSDFSAVSTSNNYIKPYKQPLSSMMPTIVLDSNDNPWATLGSPGSNRIQSAVLEVLLNLIEFDMDIQTAIEQPRFYAYPDKNYSWIEVEQTGNITNKVVDALANMGWITAKDSRVSTYSKIDEHFGGVQGIKFNSNGTLSGGADPRRDGKALGY